jgi:DNA-binding MarR family transcriptional regulator
VEEQDFGILLGLAYQAFKGELHQALGAAGFDDVKPSFGFVFRALERGPRTASQLAALLDISNPGGTKIVGEMVAAGYLERVPDPADGRAKLVRLTERGARAQRLGTEIVREIERDWGALLGEQEFETLRALLQRLHDALWPPG